MRTEILVKGVLTLKSNSWDLWVIGGDRRQGELAGLLAADGHRVHPFALERYLRCEPGLEGIGEADGVILPLPALNGAGRIGAPMSDLEPEPEAVLDRLRPGQRLLAGRVDGRLRAMAAARGLTAEDYFDREDLAVRNAVPTAEGALRIAMESVPVTIHGASCVVTGFGRVGQALALRLRALGAKVWVAERSPARQALAESLALPWGGFERLPARLATADLVFNTVPAPVLGEGELAALRQGTPVIELASAPGGADSEAAAHYGVRLIPAPGLPGKEAPLTAARALRDTVYHMMQGV